MIRTKLLLSFLLLPLFQYAQEISDLVTYELRNIDKLFTSTTYVVLDQHQESAYSKAISEAVKKYWTITPFEIIDQATYATYVKDKTKSFLTREHIAGNDQLITLNLFMGGQRGMDKKGIILASVPLKYYSETDDAMIYKIPTYVQHIQWRVRMVKEHGIKGPLDYEAYYEKRRPLVHDKKLFIMKDQLTANIPDFKTLAKYYRFDVSIVEPEQVVKAIASRDSSIAYLSIVGPIKNWNSEDGYYNVFCTHNGEALESYTRQIRDRSPYGVTAYDLNRLNKK